LNKTVKNVLLTVLSLLIFDALVAVLGGSYLSENVGTFMGKSSTVILSDFLFIEGIVILAVGILIIVGGLAQKIKPLSEPSTETTEIGVQTLEKRINLGVFMMIVGAILIGLSITVGTLLP